MAGGLADLFAGHERWMAEALKEARAAAARGEVPVGAVVVRDGCVVGRGRNQVEQLQDPTAHAEILAIGAAAAAGESWRLDDATLYVTLEPCTMCCGAILLARVGRLVYGAPDPRAGAVVSTARLLDGQPLPARAGGGRRHRRRGLRGRAERLLPRPAGLIRGRARRRLPVLIFGGADAIFPDLAGGEVREWLNRHDWKSCEPSGSEGSNPSLSATGKRHREYPGEVPERLNGAVSKTVEPSGSQGSNPCLSARTGWSAAGFDKTLLRVDHSQRVGM